MPPNRLIATDRCAPAVFPLPMTPFEYYYYLDDSPDYPTAFPVELKFSGTLVRDHFQTALDAMLGRHPMLCALVDDSGRRPRWVADQRGGPQVDWADESVAVSHAAGEYIDLKAGPGLRVWVRTSPAGARVLFQFHHACCDGLAALGAVGDLLACYRIAAGDDGVRAKLPDLDAEILRRRGALIGPRDAKRSLAAGLRDVWRTARVWWRILYRTPDVLAAPEDDDDDLHRPTLHEIQAFETEIIGCQESADLRKIAVAEDVTVNDLLLRDFLLAMRGWNRRHASSPGRLRINVPVNVRRRDEARMPAANRLGFGFVTAEPDDDDPRRLLNVVRGETQRIKQWKLGLYFLGGLEFASHVPGALSWALRRNRSFATAVLSNVGRFPADGSLERREDRWKCGDLTLERIAGVPPIRKLTRAAVVVIEYGGETALCLRCDPRYFDAWETRTLLHDFAARVRETLARGS